MPKLKTWSYEFKNDDKILIKNLTTNREYTAHWGMINDKPVIKLIKTRLPKWLTTELQLEIYKRVYQKKECKFCGNKTNEYDPYPNVCESCFDEINLENPFDEWIDS